MKKHSNRRPRRAGFTLIEVLLVLAILIVIGAMVVPNLLGSQREANIKATKLNISNVEKAAVLFAVDHDGEYPQEMSQLLVPEVSNGVQKAAYLEQQPLDAWKMPIQYQPPQESGQKPLITSYGPNKQQGDADDISNLDDQYNQQQL